MANLAVNMPNLEQLYGQGPLSGYLGMEQYQQAQQNQQANQAQALQDLFTQKQIDPLKIQLEQERIAQVQAQTPGIKAASDAAVRKQKIADAIPLDDEVKAQLSKLYTQMSDDEVKQQDNALRKALQHPSEEVRVAAYNMLLYTKEFQMERMKEEAAKQRAIDVANIGANSRQAVANTAAAAKTSAGTVDFWATFNKLKNARDKHAALISEAAKLKATSPENAQIAVLEAMAESIRPQAEQEIASVRPGAPSLPQMGIPATPGPNIAPRAGKVPVTNTPIPAGAIEMLRKNPGLAAKFDEKYGPGSSKKYLGQ